MIELEPAPAATAVPPPMPAAPPRPEAPGRLRFVALYVLPPMLLLAWLALPLVRGTKTLYMRDVLNAHLAMKWSQSRALHQGYFPLLDPYRGGGQPLAGNPNAVPFYPTNVLFLWASPFWALNAHFWIHLLLAPFAFFWMARRWGLSREAAWAAAVCYTGSGFYLSHLSFYNMIAGATLAPALVAACLGLAAPGAATVPAAPAAPGDAFDRSAASADRRRRALYIPAVAVLWALMLLGGEPLLVGLAAGLSAAALLVNGRHWLWRSAAAGADRSAPLVRRPWRERTDWSALALLAGAVACGTLVALPQIVEFLRILPVSFRGFKGYAAGVATIASWDPRQAAEWLLPALFGRLDVRTGGTFWGNRFFTGAPPFFPSLYPGLLALALVAAGGRPRGRAAWWAWGAVAVGIFCALGRYNPVMEWLFGHVGSGALRYPVKFWLPVAVGAGLLCGLGFEQLLAAAPAARRRYLGTLTALTLALGTFWALLNLLPRPANRALRLLIPADKSLDFINNERLRWAGLCMFSLLILLVLLALSRRMARSPRAAWACGGLLLAAHAAAQLGLLRSLYPTDAVTPYRVPPPALAYLPPGLTVCSPDFDHLFGPSKLGVGSFPSASLQWLERRAFYELFPFTGPLWDRRYELSESPEGLDTYLTRLAQGGLKDAGDEQRLRMLASWGVGRLLLERELSLPSQARLLAAVPSFGKHLYIYDVLDRSPEVFLARRIWLAPDMTAGYLILKDRAFEPRTDVVIPGSGPPQASPGGTVRVLRQGPESFDIDADVGAGGSLLVVQRARLLYRATIDGKPAELVIANLHRNGLSVPAGRHRIRMWVDRARFHRAVVAAWIGLLALPALALWGWRSGRRPLLT